MRGLESQKSKSFNGIYVERAERRDEDKLLELN
jgi:hypothetical protein